MSDRWKSIDEIHQEGLKYIEDRRAGIAKSLLTPWTKFNEAGIGGLEWQSILTIGGRSGSGKTLIVNQITRNAHQLNPTQTFAVLDFQFEMVNKATAVREFVAGTGMTYKKILSVDKYLIDEDFDKIKAYSVETAGRKIYQVDKALTVKEMKDTIVRFWNANNGIHMVVTVDHSILVKKSASEKDHFEMLYSLGEMMTELKKAMPIIFIVLTQLNRSIESPERRIPGTPGNYLTPSDVFGSDSLMQHSDILVGINRPWHLGINPYGPDRIVVDENSVMLHFLKVRNGEPCVARFQGDFNVLTLKDTDITGPLSTKNI